MPRKSMADQCLSGKGTKRSLRSQEESSASCSQSQAVSSASKRARSPQKPITKRSSSVTRSPILTRSRSKASALKNEQSGNCVVSPMDNPSKTPLDESLKRKNTSHSEQNSRGEGSGESQTKKSKSLRKHKKAKMSNNSTDSVEDLDNSGNPPTGNGSDVTNNQNQTPGSTAQDPSTVWDLDTMEILRSGDSGDSLLSRMIEASVRPNDIVNNLNLDNEPRAPNPLDSIFSSNRLDTHVPLANPEISQNENEITPPDLSRLRYESMRNISERKLITKSEFQKSLLSAMQMQRSKNSPANSSKGSESQSDPRPGGSGTSELHNVLRIKVEKDADGSKEPCKFSKPSNIRESVFKPLPSGSGAPPAFHSLSIKQEVDVPMSEEVSNPFLSRRIFMPDALEGESSAQGSSSASAANGSDSIDGEIGRLQALMDSRRIPLTLFGALESRMQQLFQKSMGSATSSRAQQLLQELQAAEDDEHQLQVLIEISQLLVMGNEDTLIGFPVKQIVPLLINMLLKEYNFELMNQACRALTYLIEALPRSSSIVVEAIPVLLNKVEVIQCIDVAEQALTALKMLSKWHSKAILQAKGVAACLMHLDFFSINAQRTALAIIANCCQNILPHEFCLVQDSLNTLSGWLTHQDEKSVESICLAISGLVECFQNDRASLMLIGSNSLLTNIQQLLLMSPPIVSSQIFTAVIHMLALMCSNCSEIVVFLLKQNFAGTLQYLLVNERRSKDDQIELVARSPQEYLELASLMCEIMPCLPPVELFSVNNLIVEAKRRVGLSNSVVWQWKDESGFWHSHDRNDSKVMEDAYQRGNMKQLYISSSRTALNVDLQAMEQFDEATGSPKQIRRHVIQPSEEQTKTSRGEFFKENSDLVISSIKVLFPVLFEMYCTSAGSTIKYKCLRAMIRMIYYAPPEDLDAVLKKQSIARHVASMLASQNFRTIMSALQIAEILMQKLKNDFRSHFVREGVLHEIKKLAEIDPKTWQIDPEPSTSMSAHASMIPASMDLFGADMVLPSSSKSEPAAGQSNATAPSTSAPSVPIFGSSSQPSSSAKDEESTATNVASKIRDALKRRYLNIKRSFGAGDKELSALYCSDASISNDNRIKINTWIKTQAEALNEKYFNVLFTTSHPVISVLNRLTEAVKDLENMDDVGLKGLITIRDIIDKNDISSFELIHSGLVSKLEQHLSASPKDSKPFGMVPLEERLRTFLHVFVGCPIEATPDVKPNNFDIPLFEKLIGKLNACVSHLEQFPVKVYDQPSSGNTGRPGSSIMKFFNMHQLKCLFQRHPSCTTLRQWQSGPVMIDPLASVHNVDRYLVNQGYGTLKEDDESESDLSYDDSSDEDGGLIVADIRMDHGHGTPKLQFLIGKNVLPYNMTLYQAVRQYGSGDGQASNLQLDCEYPVGYASVWMKTHTIWYRPIPEGAAEGAAASTAAEGTSSGAATASTSKKKSPSSRSSGKSADKSKSKSKKDVLWDNGVIPEVTFPSSFTSKLSGFDSIKDPSLGVIVLLRLIHGLSCQWGLLHKKLTWSSLVPQTAFINNELTLKVNRQLQDPFAVMTGNTPSWLSHIAYNFPFLFPFETRHLLFYVTSFDRERALQRLLDTVPELTNTEKMTPRLERRKRTVSRHSLLKQAEVILQEHGDSKALLEIQYKNEVGTGLGPTLEFYALISKELQRADLDMWRAQEVVPGEDQSQSYVHCPFGLFPMPVPRNARSSSLAKVCNKFKLLGKFLAKAIMDSRLVDIPLSLAFYKWMLNQEKYLSLGDLQLIDESLAHNITKMSRVLTKKKKMESENGVTEEALKHKLEKLTLEGCPIEDLGLDFTLPGYPRIELKKGGKDLNVSIHNLEDYLKLIKYWTMSEGVSKQMRAFKEGFDSVFSLNRLQVFYPYELPSLFCGEVHDKWDAQMLSESCRPDHGYTLESQAIKFLFEILCNYSSLQQRQFIQFITGSPRLPIGGFKSLTPPLTVVRKTSEDDAQSDHYLPSVMTCVNYLKLPDYSSIEIMREKLQIAISEGQRSFHLS